MCSVVDGEVSGVGKIVVRIHNNKYGGHPAPAGPALPNLINAVKMLKSKPMRFWLRRDKHVDFDFDF